MIRYYQYQSVANAPQIIATLITTYSMDNWISPPKNWGGSTIPFTSNVIGLTVATLVPGVVSFISATVDSISVSATDASGGTLPYTYIYQVALHGTGDWMSRPFSTLSASVLDTLITGTSYDIRLTYTDSTSPTPQVVYSNVLTESTTGNAPGGGGENQIPNLPQGLYSTGTAVRMGV